MSHDSYNRGLTVNEQLYAAGELKAFDEAAKRQDAEKMAEALVRAGMPISEAKKIVIAELSRKH